MKAPQPESDLDAIGHGLAYGQAILPISPDREGEVGSKGRAWPGVKRFCQEGQCRANVEPTPSLRGADAGQANLRTTDNGTTPSAVRRFLTPDPPGSVPKVAGGCKPATVRLPGPRGGTL